MRGKWAQGIQPRNFTWIVKDQFAVCERPGGYGANHRKVRRQEEIIWIRQNDFDFVMSLCGSTQNLHNYEELAVRFHHVPYGGPAGGPLSLTRAMSSIRDHVNAGEKVVVHREEVGERILGLVAAYLLWMGLVPDGPATINITERLFERELGQAARETVAMVEKCESTDAVPFGAFIDDPTVLDESEDGEDHDEDAEAALVSENSGDD
jgi:hypothetical protein